MPSPRLRRVDTPLTVHIIAVGYCLHCILMEACYVPAGEIPMTNNPVYGTTHKTITETTEEIGKYLSLTTSCDHVHTSNPPYRHL